jgi:type II secretory ATPase GspE/PulE/Tfp pilus assembly ATPase PilB-like protein/DNA-binding response OmpR family regulator
MPEKTSVRKPLILSVDDDSRIQKIIELYLTKAGYDVAFATNGAQALDKLKTIKPDLVLLDVVMPGMGGYEVCSKIQANADTAYIPVIFATALGEERDKAKAFAVGASDYLVKPIKKDDLLAKIKAHLKTGEEWNELSAAPAARPETAGKYDFTVFQNSLAAQLGLDDQAAKLLRKAPSNQLYEIGRKLNLPDPELAQLIAEHLKLPYLAYLNPNDVKLGVLPTRFCRANSIVVLSDAAAGTAFALANPFDWHLQDLLRRFASQGQKFRLMITAPDNIMRILEADEPAAVKTEAPEIPSAEPEKFLTPSAAAGAITIESIKEDAADGTAEAAASQAPIIKLANELLARGVAMGASDLHVEPRQHSLGVRYRVDGVLQESEPIPRNLGPAVISRLKIISSLDIANRRLPQDGRVAVSYKGRNLELRVSSLPSRYGEKIVIRFADPSALSLDFESLGFLGDNLMMMEACIRKPHGILLVTGPTGSGKTTTLYTALQALNDPDKNIVTVEDPIENELHRVTQVQVRPETGLTFPVALRSILRQDPDVIMIGEIRDLETADIAIKAALTGHLVLSTLHTNDAPGALIRLVDMGIDAFLVGAAMEMVMAQRLLRKLCSHCKKPFTPSPEMVEKFEAKIEKGMEFFEPQGCPQCNGSGFKGRIGIIEILTIDAGLREMFSKNVSQLELRHYAEKHRQMTDLRRDGWIKAALGLTSLEEVLRVTA